MKTLYVLIVDAVWAKLYKTGYPPVHLTLVHHQAFIVNRSSTQAADEEFAKSLHRLLKVEHKTGKFAQLMVIASESMHAVILRQFEGTWPDLLQGRIEGLPARFNDADLTAYLRRGLTQVRNEMETRSLSKNVPDKTD